MKKYFRQLCFKTNVFSGLSRPRDMNCQDKWKFRGIEGKRVGWLQEQSEQDLPILLRHCEVRSDAVIQPLSFRNDEENRTPSPNPSPSERRKSAFTLAEVLITLGIIGVVAAMTLLTLVQNNRNKELQTGLKKAYSIMGQALDLYHAENGERLTPQNIGTGWQLKPILMKYLKIAKDCGHGSLDDTACIKNYGTDNENNSTTYTTFTGNRISLTPFDDGQFVLVDGSLVLLENPTGGRLYISVDVNGYNKRPNQLGKDLFMFQIDNKGILRPMGVQGTYYYSETDEYCSKTSSHNLNGAGCTYKALTDENFFKNLK